MSVACDAFWGEIAPCEHLVQFYEEDRVFLDSLEGFVAGGLRAGDGVIVVAKPAHLIALEERLGNHGIDLWAVEKVDQYIPLDAEETLPKLVVDGWPDEERFERLATELLDRAGAGGRRVRVFGEMVAILWARGHGAATVRLERLWHGLCRQEGFSLMCAYPRAGFTHSAQDSLREICAAHSKVLA